MFLSFHVHTSHVCELYINNRAQKDKCEACTQTHMCEVDINNHAHKHTCEVCTRSYEACQSSHVSVCTYPTCTFDRRASPIRMTCTPERNVRTKFTYRPSSWRWTQWPGTPPSDALLEGVLAAIPKAVGERVAHRPKQEFLMKCLRTCVRAFVMSPACAPRMRWSAGAPLLRTSLIACRLLGEGLGGLVARIYSNVQGKGGFKRPVYRSLYVLPPQVDDMTHRP